MNQETSKQIAVRLVAAHFGAVNSLLASMQRGSNAVVPRAEGFQRKRKPSISDLTWVMNRSVTL